MATIKASFTRLVVFMLISLTESAAITQFFDVSFSTSASGNCYGYENQINSAIEDVVTLAQYLDQAVQFASEQFSEETEPDEEKTLVAQKLFGAYFGITFDGSKAISDDEDDWNDLQSYIKTYTDFIQTGNYPTPKDPPHLFCGSPGYWFDWNAAAFGPDGQALTDGNGNGFSIKDVYSSEYDKSQSSPYWVPAMQGYMFLPLYYQDDLCDTILPGQAETFWAITFQGNKPKVNLADGSDLPIKESAVPENIVLCPKTFSANQNNYATLSDVYNAATEAMSKEGIDPSLQLSEILPESATLYHEIWHMVTYWDYISNGYNDVKNNGNEFVGDVTYDLTEVLELGIEGIKNAETYVFFAMAWWFYAARDDWYNEEEGTFFTETFEPWDY